MSLLRGFYRRIHDIFSLHERAATAAQLLQHTIALHGQAIQSIANALIAAFRAQRKIIILGNSRSYADALHFAAELEGTYRDRTRHSLPALVPANPAAITAIGNDFGYDKISLRFIYFQIGFNTPQLAAPIWKLEIVGFAKRKKIRGNTPSACCGDSEFSDNFFIMKYVTW